MEEADRCAVCLEPLSEGELMALPGCAHTYHSRCYLNHAQHDLRCPVCRRPPDGVRERPDPVFEFLFGGEPSEEESAEWRRYKRRRARYIRQHSRLRQRQQALKELVGELRRETRQLERTFERRCQQLWHEEFREARALLSRMRRRERYQRRCLEHDVEVGVGPAP